MLGLLSTGSPFVPPMMPFQSVPGYEWGWEGRRQSRKVYHAVGSGLGPLLLVAAIGLTSQSSRTLKRTPDHLCSVWPTSGTCHLS